MNKTSTAVTAATRSITKQVIEMNAGFLASQGAAGGAALAFGRVLGVLGPIALGVTVIADTFKLMAYATDLATKKIEEFAAMSEKASSADVSTDFFQRITKAGEQVKLSVDDATASLKRFRDVNTDKLGGSEFGKRVGELSDAGNFKGNSGVGALSQATSTEDKYRGTVKLITEALDKGERLAALDLADKAFGPKVTENLRANSGYLDYMLRRADQMSKTQLVSPEDNGRALELKERMEQAQKILSEKWKPIQDDLAKLGMNYHESWVGITESLASAVGYATQLYMALQKVPDWFAKRIGGASVWKSLTESTTTPEMREEAEKSFGITSDPKEMADLAANNKLRAALQDRASILRGMREATAVQSAVRGDKSNDPNNKPPPGGGERSYFDTAADAIERHTVRMKADTEAVGLGAGAQEALRAKALLFTAAQQAGIPVTDAMIERIKKLSEEAGKASEGLARGAINSNIKFGSQTAFLDPAEVQIAQQLRQLYGDDVPRALASSEAAALRFTSQLSQARDFTSDFAKTFAHDMLAGKSAIDSFKDALQSLSTKLLDKSIDSLINGLFSGLSGGGSGGGFAKALSSLFSGHADGGLIAGPGGPRSDSIVARLSAGEYVMNAASTSKFLPMLEAMNSGRLPRFVDGGMVMPGGAQVIPNDVLRRGGGGTPTFSPTYYIDATGADAGTVQRIQAVLATHAKAIQGQQDAVRNKWRYS